MIRRLGLIGYIAGLIDCVADLIGYVGIWIDFSSDAGFTNAIGAFCPSYTEQSSCTWTISPTSQPTPAQANS